MFQRIYAGLWLIFAIVLIALFLANALSVAILVAIGFVALALAFVGMTWLLPSTVAYPHEKQRCEPKPPKVFAAARHLNHESFLQPWFFPDHPENGSSLKTRP